MFVILASVDVTISIR